MKILFAQIDKIFDNFVGPDEYLQHQWMFVSDNEHMHLLQSSHESSRLTTEFLPGGGYHCVILVKYNYIHIYLCAHFVINARKEQI